MGGRSSRVLIALVLATWITLAATPGTAQPRNAGFEYDSTFVIGAHTVPAPASLVRDSLRIDFTYHYDAPSSAAIDGRVYWSDSVTHDLYYQPDRRIGDSVGLRTVFTPPVLKSLHGYVNHRQLGAGHF